MHRGVSGGGGCSWPKSGLTVTSMRSTALASAAQVAQHGQSARAGARDWAGECGGER
jgi:hypothetical protein